jgi:phosphinothricin acetyltransferase
MTHQNRVVETDPMNGLTIRPCEQGDIAAITEIYSNHVFHSLATFECEPPGREEMTMRWRSALERGFPYLVAERQGEVVGYAYAGPYRARPAYRYAVENSVYVRADSARQGIGLTLLQALIQECEQKDFRQMIAVIGDSANYASIGLHERLGFRMVGVLRSVGFKFGRWVDTVLMQRELGAGDHTLPA